MLFFIYKIYTIFFHYIYVSKNATQPHTYKYK